MPEEQVALVDEVGQVLGSAPRSVVRRDNLRHLVVAALVRDARGRIYVHRRTDTKDVFPGLHDCWVAGCVSADEPPDAAILRELDEELGIRGVPVSRLFEASYADAHTRQVCIAYATTYEGPITHQPEEVASGGWMELDELRPLMTRQGWATPDGRALFEEWLHRPATR